MFGLIFYLLALLHIHGVDIESEAQEDEEQGCGCGMPTNRDGLQGAGSCEAKDLEKAGSCEANSVRRAEDSEPQFSGKALGCGLVTIPRGSVKLGDCNKRYYVDGDGECPQRKVKVSSFRIQICEVTNAQFYLWWKENYVGKTDAEAFGWSFVFELLVSPELNAQIDQAVQAAPWWIPVDGADFLHPFGPDTHVDDLGIWDHPAMHISWNDANAYCQGIGMRLPTEAEWEYAAKAGSDTSFWWGDDVAPNLTIDGTYSMNIFTGHPYTKDDGSDGWPFTSPVGSYQPNPFGLYDTTGNVWEWVSDWWTGRPRIPKAGRAFKNPKGPKRGNEKTMKGGSYMCHMDSCKRFRPAGRHHATKDSSTGNMGVRCVKDL